MFNYNVEKLDSLFRTIMEANLPADTHNWLLEQAKLAGKDGDIGKFKIAFSLVSRKITKPAIDLTKQQEEEIEELVPGLSTARWSMKKLCRIWLVMQVDAEDKERYIKKIEELFGDADMNELATLYAALPILAYPEQWKKQCAEGIRSNIGYVLDAVIMDNPYPAQHLSEEAWNQLILKAFFTDKDISRIIGLQARMNENLANSLRDYVDERKAADREVNPKIFELLGLLENN